MKRGADRQVGNPPDLSIIVPTYNERDRLAELVETVFAVLRREAIEGEIVIVDDNSPDGTGRAADALAARWPIRVVHRAGKLGLGTAVVDGFRHAGADVLGVMDADLSHPPELLPVLLRTLLTERVDVVVGSRYVAGGGCRDWSFGRLLMSRVACWLARPLTPVRDATSGFFLIRRRVAHDVTLGAGGFKICLELLVRGHAEAVAEVPYLFVGRTAGKSKMNGREALGYLRQLFQLLRVRYAGPARGRRVRYARP